MGHKFSHVVVFLVFAFLISIVVSDVAQSQLITWKPAPLRSDMQPILFPFPPPPQPPPKIGSFLPTDPSCMFGRFNATPNFPGGFIADSYAHNVSEFSQFFLLNWGNNSCAPTSAAVMIEYLNRTSLPGIMGNHNLSSLVIQLRMVMGTTNNGTTMVQALQGLFQYIQATGYDHNITINWYFPGITLGGNPLAAPQNITLPGGLRVGLIPRAPNYTDYHHELFVNNEQILMFFVDPLGAHVVAADDISTHPNANGWFNVSFMDPGTATGTHTSTEMHPSGQVRVVGGTGLANFVGMITVSPV
jgi:hypothetical protein